MNVNKTFHLEQAETLVAQGFDGVVQVVREQIEFLYKIYY